MEVVVGILSLLVTVLIGWNIYTLIDFKEKDKEFKIIKDRVVAENMLLREKLFNSLIVSYHASYLTFHSAGCYSGAIVSLICILRYMLYDASCNVDVGNFERVGVLLKNDWIEFESRKCEFGTNNCRILEDSFKEIQQHENWVFFKKDYEAIFNKILEQIGTESRL